MRKIDKLDVVNIKKEAEKQIKIKTEIRFGQAIVIAAQKLFPGAECKLRNSISDCFYDDSKVPVYLQELQKLNAE